MEAAEKNLDSVLTADLDQESLAVLLWTVTGIKPNTRTCDLHCKNFRQAEKKIKARADRFRHTEGPALIEERVSKCLMKVSTENIKRLAYEYGFLDEYLQKTSSKTSGSGNAKGSNDGWKRGKWEDEQDNDGKSKWEDWQGDDGKSTWEDWQTEEGNSISRWTG